MVTNPTQRGAGDVWVWGGGSAAAWELRVAVGECGAVRPPAALSRQGIPGGAAVATAQRSPAEPP